MKYFVQTMPGVEPIAWLEIRSRMSSAKFGEFLYAEEQNGIVTFDYADASEELLSLRTVEDVFVLGLSLPKVSRDWRDIRQVRDLVQTSAEFGGAVDVVLRHRKYRRPPTYRVISRKYGRHQYRRKDLEQAVTKGLETRYPRWRLVGDDSQIEVWVNMLGSYLLIGLRLSDRSMRHRHKRTKELKASLRPSVAAAMVYLTQPEPNDRFLDPMCGSGTLLLERRVAQAYDLIAGGDIAQERADTAWHNLAAQRKDLHEKPIAVCCWDGRGLPLAPGTISKVASNLPFGKQILPAQPLDELYLMLIGEIERVLRPGGRAVLLSSEYDLVKESVRRCPGLAISGGYSIAVLGRWGRIYIVERGE